MAETIINTGRSSFFDNYHSDGDTNSDTINDFSDYSSHGIIVNNEEIRELTPQPPVKSSVPIVLEDSRHTIKTEIHISDDDSMNIDDDEEDNSLFEITKKTTIRKIISKTTSINGVEKENEVKEYLIKDSQINDSLLESGRRDSRRGSRVSVKDDINAFMSSRRGSLASARRKSLSEENNKDKIKNDRSRKYHDATEYVKGNLEKINDELEEKEMIMHSDQGLSWTSPSDVVGTDEKCEFRIDQNDTIERVNIPIIYNDKIEDNQGLSDDRIKISFDEPVISTESNLINWNDNNDAKIKSEGIEDDDVNEKCDVKIIPNLSRLPEKEVSAKLRFQVSSQNSVNMDENLTNFETFPRVKDTGYSNPSIENDLADKDQDLTFPRDQHKSFTDKERKFANHYSSVDVMKWIDPTKSYHLKYDSNNDNSNRKKIVGEKEHSLKNVPSKTNRETSKVNDYNKTNSSATTKSSLINEIKDYIIRGNIKENLYQIRNPNIEQAKSQSNVNKSSKRCDAKTKTASRGTETEKYKFTSYNSNIDEQSKNIAPRKLPIYNLPKQSSRFTNSSYALKRYDSMDNIGSNRATGNYFSRDDTMKLQVSKILGQVDDLEKHLSESLPSKSSHHSGFVTTVSSPCCHTYCCYTHCCYGNTCMDRNIRLNTIARHNLASCEQNICAPIQTCYKSDEPSTNRTKSKSLALTLIDKRSLSTIYNQIAVLEKRLHALQKDLKEFRTNELKISMSPEINLKSQCRTIEIQLDQLHELIRHSRAVS